MTTSDELVWYAGYGSNLSRDRFSCYVRGGTPAGAHHRYAGCRDRTPPRRWVRLDLAGRLGFAGESLVWGGGMAFLDPDVEGRVVARGYLVTAGQLEDVAAQEPRYDRVLPVGEHDGRPAFALTRSEPYPPAPPGATYLRTILAGLTDGLLDRDPAVDYVLACDGVGTGWDRARVADLLEQPAGRRG